MSHHHHAPPSPRHARTSLAVHAAVFVVVNAILAVVDLQSSGNTWFHWPLLGWGAGLAWHAWIVQRHVGVFRPAAERLPSADRDA